MLCDHRRRMYLKKWRILKLRCAHLLDLAFIDEAAVALAQRTPEPGGGEVGVGG